MTIYWVVVIGNGFFGATGDLKQISKPCMSNIVAQSAENNSENFAWGQYMFIFVGVA